MVRIRTICIALALVMALSLGGSAYAFQDMQKIAGNEKVDELQKLNLISGMNKNTFNPDAKLTNAEAATMIVKGMQLNIDHLRFIKEPKASDYFTNVRDDAWYAQPFVIAHLNNVGFPANTEPKKHTTREQFAVYLYNAMMVKGDYAFIEMWMQINDEQQIDKDAMTAIQHLLIANIATLDKNGNFRPQQPITRLEAALMLYEAVQFVQRHPGGNTTVPAEPSHQQENIVMMIEKVTEQVNKVVLTWDERPTAGYNITIAAIEFRDDQTAVVRYRLHYPEPDMMQAQVITHPKAETYVDANYTPVAEPVADDAADSNFVPGSVGGGVSSSANGEATTTDRIAP